MAKFAITSQVPDPSQSSLYVAHPARGSGAPFMARFHRDMSGSLSQRDQTFRMHGQFPPPPLTPLLTLNQQEESPATSRAFAFKSEPVSRQLANQLSRWRSEVQI